MKKAQSKTKGTESPTRIGTISPTPKAALARIPSLNPSRYGRKNSGEPDTPAARSDHGSGLYRIMRPQGKNLTVQGGQKVLNDRSQNSIIMNEVISLRLQQQQQQQQNEGTQANFDTVSNYGNVMNQTEPLSPYSPMPPAASRMLKQKQNDLYIEEKQRISPSNIIGAHKGLLESRSSVLIPEVTSSNASKRMEQDSWGHQEVDRANAGSKDSFRATTDINVAKIEILRNTKTSRFDSPKGMRKAATNNRLSHLPFKSGDKNNGSPRRNLSQMMMQDSLGRDDQPSSPVIITSLEKQKHKAIVFDVRSETPTSMRHHKTPQMGAEVDDDTVKRNASAIGSETINDEPQTLQVVRVSPPIVEPAMQSALDALSQDLNEVMDSKNNATANESSNFRGPNTMSISLFEDSLFKNPNQISPFRQSSHWRTNKAILASLDSNTDGSEPHEGDTLEKQLFRKTIAQHETVSGKKWKNMTPYERSKVLNTFTQMQRCNERVTRRTKDAENPSNFRKDLSMCINVGNIKPGPNPHIRLAELKGYGARTTRAAETKTVQFSNETLNDPKKIIQQVLEQKSGTHEQHTQQSGVEIRQSQNEFTLNSEVQVSATEPSVDLGMTQSQINIEELSLTRNQQETLIQEQNSAELFQQPNVGGPTLETSSLGVTPQPSVLHSRYPIAIADMIIDQDRSLTMLQNQIKFKSQSSLKSERRSRQEQQPEASDTRSSKLNSDLRHIESVLVQVPPSTKAPVSAAVGVTVASPAQPRNIPREVQRAQTLNLAVVPEEIQLFRQTQQSLGQKIKETFEAKNNDSKLSKVSVPQQNQSNPTLAPSDSKQKTSDLQSMSQMSLQAISLTKKYQHQAEMSKADRHRQQEAEIVIALQSEEITLKLSQEQLPQLLNGDEGNSEVIDLAPTVNQSKLNKHKLTTTANTRVIQHTSNELDNISAFLQTNTAKADHCELKSLENRLRDYQGGKNDSMINDSVSDAQSKLTHLQEPRLPKNQHRSKDVTKNGSIATHSDQTRNNSTQHYNSSRLGMVVGTRVTQPSINRKERKSSVNVSPTGESILQQQTIRDRSKRKKNLDLYNVSSSIQSSSMLKVVSVIKNQQKIDTTQEFAVTNTSITEKQSINTNRLESQIASMLTPKNQYLRQTGRSGDNEIQVGASYTFYNEKEMKNSMEERENNRNHANSELLLASPSPASPERSQDDDDDEEVEDENLAEISSLHSPDRLQDSHSKSIIPPQPIAANTPLKLQRVTRGIYQVTVSPTQEKEKVKLTALLGEATPIQKVTLEEIKKSHQIFHDSATADFKRTANFATQMNKSTGLPVTSAAINAQLSNKSLDPFKHSYVTTIQFGDQSSAYQSQNLIVRRGGASRFKGGGPTLSQSARQSIGDATAVDQSDEKVFIDKRTHQGQKLMLNDSQSRTTVNAANLGFAMSPLARRGQQVIALGARSSRRQITQTKTPLSKLLTAAEMAEFKKALAAGKQTKVVYRNKQPDGEFFKQGLAAREMTINQVSTSRIAPNDFHKASKIDLNSSMSGGPESPPMSPTLVVSTPGRQSPQWQPLKQVKPSFLKMYTDSNEYAIKTPVPELTVSPKNNGSEKRIQMTVVRNNETADGANVAVGSTRYMKTGKRWHGNTMRSTRYLNDSRLEDVKLVGIAATINISESPSKDALTELNSLLKSNPPELEEVLKVARKTDFNSQTDLTTIEQAAAVPSKTVDVQTVAVGAQPASISQGSGHLNQDIFISPTDTAYEQKETPLITVNRDSAINKRRQSSDVVPSGLYINQKNGSIATEQLKKFTIIDDQVVHIANGVLPRYKINLTQKQQVLEQARQQRYSSLKVKGAIGGGANQQRLNALGQSSTLPGVKKAFSTRNNKRQLSENGKFFVFNDVKNWKKNMEKHTTLGELSLKNSLQKSTAIRSSSYTVKH